MRRIPVITAALVAAAAGALAAQSADPAVQIAAAAQAAPAERREGVTVMGHDGSGRLVTLRKGTNDLICLADDPAVEGFEVSCHHQSLGPFMARGRELTAAGVTGQERQAQRFREAASGALKMPDRPAMQYILTGDGFDAGAGKVTNEYRRSVIYVPFATTESTGLSARASDVDPWLMFPGTPGAHIMITPPRRRAGG